MEIMVVTTITFFKIKFIDKNMDPLQKNERIVYELINLVLWLFMN